MVGDVLSFDGPESAETHMESHERPINLPFVQSLKYRRREVEARGRRRYRARLLGVDSLIAQPVGLGLLAFADVGQQWDVTVVLEVGEAGVGTMRPPQPAPRRSIIAVFK